MTRIYYRSYFYAIFQKYINLRESCYNCQFADTNRLSDITIGDFHEIDRYMHGINRFDGISIVIVNSEKGKYLWNLCREEIVQYSMDLDTLIADGICFVRNKRPDRRDEFINDYESRPLEEVLRKYANPRQYWKQGIYYSLPEFVRKWIKKQVGV